VSGGPVLGGGPAGLSAHPTERVIGGEIEYMGDNVGGLAVHIGARVGAIAEPSQVLVSSTVHELVVGSGLNFTDQGTHELKGVPGRWHLYRATERTSPTAG
jgi:class 3 adenylate cyclase